MAADLANFDIRAEWFFDDGDGFTTSLFYKDIEAPIETIESPGTDDSISLTFINAGSAEMDGIELEWLGVVVLEQAVGSVVKLDLSYRF